MFEGIRCVLLDSGHVLARPRSGDWFMPEAFREYCAAHGLKEKDVRLSLGRHRAYRYLCSNHRVRDEAEEYEQFKKYYELSFGLSRGHERPELIELCARAKTYDDSTVEFYPDVDRGLRVLRSSYRLGILSDAWPSLDRIYRNAGLRGLFDAFIISSVHGSIKSEGKLFDIALSELGVVPGAILFVDDGDENLRMAKDKGMHAVRMNRGSRESDAKTVRGFPEVGNLEALAALLKT